MYENSSLISFIAKGTEVSSDLGSTDVPFPVHSSDHVVSTHRDNVLGLNFPTVVYPDVRVVGSNGEQLITYL